MRMKQTMAAVLSAAMLMSGGVAALAADPAPTDPPAASTPETTLGMLNTKMEVTEVAQTSGVYPYLVAKEILPEGSQKTVQEIRLNLDEQTACIDSKTGLAANLETVKKGDIISATYSSAMTRSIPPQSYAYAIVVNLDEKAAPANYLIAEKVTKNEDGSVTVLAQNGTILVTIGKDTPISPYKTKNTVKNSDIAVGTSFFAWYDVVALSMPGQAHATKAVILPKEEDAATQDANATDEQKPLEPGQTTAYRHGTKATVTAVNTETVDGDMVVVKSYTLKSENENLVPLVANVTSDTLLIDNQSGQAVNDVLKLGATVYVYYGSIMTASNPAQVSAELILVNVGQDSAPARLLTVERSEHNVDGSVRLLGDNKSLWVTVSKDTPVTALKTKNIVKSSDLHTGAKILAWYDAVQESMPAQTNATKVVVLPDADTIFTIITGGDIAIAEGKVENGVAMVPLRKVAETLGFTVSWNEQEQSIKLTNDKVQTTVRLGQDSYYYATAIEGMVGMSSPTSLGAAAYEQGGTSYVPAELFSMLGFSPTLTGTVMHL